MMKKLLSMLLLVLLNTLGYTQEIEFGVFHHFHLARQKLVVWGNMAEFPIASPPQVK